MNYDTFIEHVKNGLIEHDQIYSETGGPTGLFLLFAKWKDDITWSFVQSYLTKQGVQHMLTTFAPELYDKQEYKLMFANGNTETFTELFNTMELKNDQRNTSEVRPS